MKRFAALLVCLLLFLSAMPALAGQGDVETVDMRTTQELTTDCSFLCLTCMGVEGETYVTITDDTGEMVYQKNYGMRSGMFRSDEIYLSLNGGMQYQVKLEVGGETYALTLRRRMPRQRGGAACSLGCPMSLVTGRNSWKSVTILDLEAMDEPVVMPMADGMYTLGRVTFTAEKGRLVVSAEMEDGINGVIDSARVFAADNILDARRLDTRQFAGATGPLDRPLDLRGSRYVIVYVQLSVSFDPSGAAPAPEAEQPGQRELLDMMNRYTINEEVG